MFDCIAGLWERIEHVGSRVTCDPMPLETDDDYIVLALPGCRDQLESALLNWIPGGSEILDEVNSVPPDGRFRSYRLGEINLIVTESPVFFQRFMAATSVAKRLNLLDKRDRIALFQAVLYGNGC